MEGHNQKGEVMISDTLSDAAADIRDYLRELPDVYKPVAGEVTDVLAAMDRLRIKLDTPPRPKKAKKPPYFPPSTALYD